MKFLMDKANDVGEIFESFLDDIYDELGSVQQKASTKVVTDVIREGRPVEDFPFTMQFQINHLGKESRKSENEFITRLKKFDEEWLAAREKEDLTEAERIKIDNDYRQKRKRFDVVLNAAVKALMEDAAQNKIE